LVNLLRAGWTCAHTPSIEDSWTAPGISVSLIDVSATINLYPDEPITKTTQTYDGAVGNQQLHKCYTPVLHVSRNLPLDNRPTTSIEPFAAVTQYLSPIENTMFPRWALPPVNIGSCNAISTRSAHSNRHTHSRCGRIVNHITRRWRKLSCNIEKATTREMPVRRRMFPYTGQSFD